MTIPPSPNPLPTTEGVTQGRLTTIQRPLPDWAEDERAAILEQLAMIEKHYRAQAQPYMDRLAKLEGYRPPPIMFIRSDPLPPPPGQP